MSEKALIIGGSRFVGPYLIELLQQDAQQVTVFNRGNHTLDIPGIEVIKGDRHQDLDKLTDHYDVVYDMCAYTGQDTDDLLSKVNFDFLVHFGTVSAYSKPTTYPIVESHPLGDWFAGEYGSGKAECEDVLKDSAKPHAVLRPTYVLGAKNYSPRESFIYRHILQGKALNIPGNGQALNQFVFVDEVAKSLFELGKQRVEGAYNCTGNESITLIELVKRMAIIAIGSEKTPVVYDAEHDQELWDRESFPFANVNMVFDNRKIKEIGVGFTPLLDRLQQDWDSYYQQELNNFVA